MSDLAQSRRDESRERLRWMTPAARVAEALLLGERSIQAYAAAHGLPREEARRHLDRAGQAGRRPSRVMREIIA